MSQIIPTNVSIIESEINRENEVNFLVEINGKSYNYFYVDMEIVNVIDLDTEDETFDYELLDYELLMNQI